MANKLPTPITASKQEPLARGAVAGLMLLAALLVCGGVGGAIGTLVGAFAPLLVLGILVGFFAGIAAVRARFPDL